MARQRIDIGSKWLLHTQGKGALLIGGLMGVQRIEPMPGEIAQSRRWPDGLLRVFLRGEQQPHHVLVEVATYAEKRARQQALNDLDLAYSALGYLPELLMLVLRPKGRFQIGGQHEVRSRLGLASLTATWRLIELWSLSAELFLAEGDVGIVPWVPLMQFEGPPEALLERCAEKIERVAHPKDRADLLAVAQVLSELRFPNPELLRLFGGKQAMIESPLLQKMRAETRQDDVLAILKDRFSTIPQDVTKLLRAEINEKKLRDLNVMAAKCPDLQAFRDALLS